MDRAPHGQVVGGETIAAPCVTLMDDPLLPHGNGSRPFDAEGVPYVAVFGVNGDMGQVWRIAPDA